MQQIERREYKYIVDEPTAWRVRQAAAPFCRIDPNAARTGGRYLIDSLYYDSQDLECYWAVEHECVDRFKLRVRTYPEATRPLAFLEVKRRINDVVKKTRARAPGDWARLLATPGQLLAAAPSPGDRQGLDNFLVHYHALKARPVARIRYQREPYFGVYDDYSRVTFDRDIKFQLMHGGDLAPDLAPWRSIDDPVSMRACSSLVVLELKFAAQVPTWMSNIVRTLELPRLSFSKYGRAIEAFHSELTYRDQRVANSTRW